MGEVVKMIDRVEERFKSVAPNYIKFDAERGFAIQLLSNNDYLMRCAEENPDSLLQAISNVAAIGLSLNPAEKLAYLIPRNVKVNGQFRTRVYLEPSYMGLCKLATDSGSIEWVQAVPVFSNDKFEIRSAGEKPFHEYDPFMTVEQRGDFRGVYCVAKTHSGDFLTTTMSREDVDAIRDRSESWKAFKAGKTKTGGPWQTDFLEQAKKTVVRRGFKMWPRTDDKKLAHAIDLSNSNEGFEPILTAPALGEYTANQKDFFDELINKSDAWGMFVFNKTLDRQTFTNLYHSFEKGTKGKYQKVIDALLAEGGDKFQSILADVEAVCSSGDEIGLQEIIEEMNKDELQMILNSSSRESVIFINEFKEKQ